VPTSADRLCPPLSLPLPPLFSSHSRQFCNLANLYFLLVGIFQIVPVLSTTNGNPTMYQPLAFIVLVSALRAAKEDWDKHVADELRNGFRYSIVREHELLSIESGDIRVGDIVKVMQNNMIPADMLFLSSSLSKGHCFIDKSNLNGETTLEVCNSMTHTRLQCKDLSGLSSLSLSITYEPPNKRFDAFRGSMTHSNGSTPVQEYSIDGKSLIMRETNLRNCEYIYGLVVYTGMCTAPIGSGGERETACASERRARVCAFTYMRVCSSCMRG
jgi:magnesium-transporting ATPase (P-type)